MEPADLADKSESPRGGYLQASLSQQLSWHVQVVE
jgi:hypothetical protein